MGKFCRVVSKVGYETAKQVVYKTKRCSKTDNSAAVSAACTCGKNAQTVANGKLALEATKLTCVERFALCAKNDGAAVTTSDCSCVGTAGGVLSVNKDKACRVVTNVPYQTDKIKCSKTDAKVKVDADCTCGYKDTMDHAKKDSNEFCWENTDGKGYVYSKKMCSSTDGSANVDADCMCGTNKQAVAKDKTAVLAADKTCSAHEVKCATTDAKVAVTADCTCGYKDTMVDGTKDTTFCWENTDGKGYAYTKKMCSKTH